MTTSAPPKLERLPVTATPVAVTGLGGFVRLAAEGAVAGLGRWKKEVLRVWSGIDPNTGKKLAFSREDLELFARCTNRWIALGNEVWAPDGHTDEAMKNLGWWREFFVEGDVLFGHFEPALAEVAERLGTAIKGVSVAIRGPVQHTDGEVFPAVILHCCLTPCPVLPGQSDFVRLARETAMADDKKKTDETPDDKKKPDADMAEGAPALDLAATLKVLLGLDAEVDDKAIIAAVRERVVGGEGSAEGEVLDDAAPAGSAMAKLAREVEARVEKSVESKYARRIADLELGRKKAEESARAEKLAGFDREVELARERSALPIPQDKVDLAKSLFARGLEVEARAFLETFAPAEQLGLALSRPSTIVPPRTGSSSKLPQAERDEIQARINVHLSRGEDVELDADGRIKAVKAKQVPTLKEQFSGRR